MTPNPENFFYDGTDRQKKRAAHTGKCDACGETPAFNLKPLQTLTSATGARTFRASDGDKLCAECKAELTRGAIPKASESCVEDYRVPRQREKKP